MNVGIGKIKLSSNTTISMYIYLCVYVCSYPADILALRSRGKCLGPDDGVSSHKRVLMMDIMSPLLGPNDRSRMRETVHACLFIHLIRQREHVNKFPWKGTQNMHKSYKKVLFKWIINSYVSIQRFELNLCAKLEYHIKHMWIKHRFHPTSQKNCHFLVNCGTKYH